MGQAILYCFRCSTQLRDVHFERGKAYKIDAWVCCADCAPEALKSLPPDRVQVLLKLIAGQEKKPPGPGRDSNSRMTLSAAPPPPPAAPAPASNKLVLIIAAAVVVIGLIILIVTNQKPSVEPAVRVPDPPAPAPGPKPPPRVDLPPPPPPGDSPQKQAFKKAQQFAREHPDDVDGQLKLFGDLSLLEDRTEIGAEARKTVEALQLRQRQAVEKGLAALEPEIADPIRREDYGKVFRLIEAAGSRLAGAQWKLALEKRELEIREKLFTSFETAKAKSLDARAKGNKAELDATVAKVRSWGMAKLTEELDRLLAAPADGTPVPAPPTSAEAKAYAAQKEQAMGRAAGRDFAGAAADLERAAAALKEDAVKKESADDVRDLKELDKLYQSTIAALASSKTLTLRTVDDRTATGRVLSIDADRVELFADPGKPSVFIEWSDVRASSLSPHLKAQNGDARLIALFERLDDVARPKTAAEELRARELYYEAERQFREMATREKSIEAYRQLKAKFKDTTVVRHALARIDRRSESGKEYYFLPADLGFSGTFSMTKEGRIESLAASEPAQESRNWVEWEFHPLPSATYRCWALVGGCCAEAFAVHLQATGLTELNPKTKKRGPAEPGGDLASPLKHSIRNLKPTHPKGEPQKATRWEWVEIPLPRSTAPGTRRVRLLTDQQGFGVAAVSVSATRTKAPTDAEGAEMAKARALDAPPSWATQKRGNSSRILLDDFEQNIGVWGFHPGSEFPGAKGGQSHDPSSGRDGKGCLKLSADFTAGGSYVSTGRTLPVGSDFKELRFWFKSDTAVHLGIRVGDGTDQCHQRPLSLQSTREWQEVVLNFEQIAGRESWGGANDRKWHGPAKYVAICVSITTFGGAKSGEVWIDDVEGVLNLPEQKD
jgi:hypothetical protein